MNGTMEMMVAPECVNIPRPWTDWIGVESVDKRTCSVDGCLKSILARGWCGMHYERWRNHGDPLVGRKPRKTCSIEGCAGRAVGRGWCGRHYARWARHGDPLYTKPQRACAIDGCAEKSVARGWCRKHWERWNTHGDPRREPDMSGEGNPNWGGDGIGYNAAHRRVERARGLAKDLLCVDCGDSAKEWSYDRNGGLREKTEQFGAYAVPYSPDPDHYSPRCVPCHRAFDAKKGVA